MHTFRTRVRSVPPWPEQSARQRPFSESLGRAHTTITRTVGAS
jgi:hypothetical protein